MKQFRNKCEAADRLNIGCGRQTHPDWTNIDLVPANRNVLGCDIRKGLPFPANRFEAVYHSHLLEHLPPHEGEALVRECYRVLKPGGILRIVVPDLERIAELYLNNLRMALTGNPDAMANYEWMKLELLDQLVRSKSGGNMGPYMIDVQRSNSAFVRERIGLEINSCAPDRFDEGETPAGPVKKLGSTLQRFRRYLASAAVRMLLGREGESAFTEGLFRNSGEVHRWMYDRLSLRDLCLRQGFSSFSVCRADESRIESFGRYQLDMYCGEVRKPDSLFVECLKPRPAVAIRAAA